VNAVISAHPRALPYGQHLIEDDDVEAVVEVLRGDWLTSGPRVVEFEHALTPATGAGYATAVSSGTAALHLAACALGVGEGDAVVVPAITFLATANAARYVGAEVVFADVDPETGLMGARELDEAVARARQVGLVPRAVFTVHLAGQCSDPESLSIAAAAHGLSVVEDASHSLGTTYGSGDSLHRVGACAHSKMTTFSFHPVKTIAMGEGGAVTTNDEQIAERLTRLRNHGVTREASQFESPAEAFDVDAQANPWYYEMQELGFNYRVSDINCALGISQLRKLEPRARRRAALVARYCERLADFSPVIRPLSQVADCSPCWHLFVSRIDFRAIGPTRAEVMRRLSERGIASQVHYIPLTLQPYYRARYGTVSLPGASAYYEKALSLPLFAHMADEDVDRVVAELQETLGI
jgi:UDP-4-amino-4,6-dideoxy-N-acetyl-beta-L-altrosamine transaminase